MKRVFSVAYYDDDKGERVVMSSVIKSLNSRLSTLQPPVEIAMSVYEDYIELCEDIQKKKLPDLLVLDMYGDSGGTHDGIEVLRVIKAEGLKIPCILFTRGFIDGHPIDFDKLYIEYDFILGEKVGKEKRDEVPARIMDFIQRNQMSNQFIADEDDAQLAAQVLSVGNFNLNVILSQIQEKFDISDKIPLQVLSSGFSGAAIFRAAFNQQSFILKISRDKEKLRKEHEKAQQYFEMFPRSLRTLIKQHSFSNHEVYAILIEEVRNAQTLFSWLQAGPNEKDIQEVLFKLYFKNSLSSHYKEISGPEHKFDSIFSGFSPAKFTLVANSIKELKPIIDFYGLPVSQANLRQIVVQHTFGLIDKSATSAKSTVLAHGDFHSNNIMVQDSEPVLIDTGGMQYGHWTTDICRLIVHLLTIGCEEGRVDFFDLANISVMMDKVQKIADGKLIDKDARNDSFISAINWLIENAPKIYERHFAKWEFLLGLTKEFVQMGYRAGSVPASRRVFALAAACRCLESAQKEFTEIYGT